MTLEEFRKYVVEHFKEHMPKARQDVEVSLMKNTRNNNVTQEGLMVRRPNSNVTPVIGLEPFYEAHQGGMCLNDIMEKLADIYIQSVIQLPHFDKEMVDYDTVRDKIFVAACNAEMNSEVLLNAPCELNGELAEVYRIRLTLGEGMFSMLVTNQQLEQWGISREVLKETAWENMRRDLGLSVENLTDFIKKKESLGAHEDFFDIIKELNCKNRYYVMTNNKVYYGAAYMLAEKELARAAEYVDSDIIIIPSSIHSCLFLSDKEIKNVMGDGEAYELYLDTLRKRFVKINEEMKDRAEWLSDEIYYFDRQTQKLSIISAPEQEQGMSMQGM